jgi:hypothetical protein
VNRLGRLRSAALALAVALPAFLAGCGDDESPPEIDLMAAFQWNQSPTSPADIGYEALVDFGWPARAQSCFPLPEHLHVIVNDRELSMYGGDSGDCLWDLLFRGGPFPDDAPATIRVLDGDRLMGQATFEGVFPGFHARLIAPADGRVHPGEDVVVSVPDGLPGTPAFLTAQFYWLDPPAGVPPFGTWAAAELTPDNLSATTKAPTVPGLTGRAALIFQVADTATPLAVSCTGFRYCSSRMELVIGPISVEVVPEQQP